MVATVLRLRFRILGNTLARRPWQLVGFCFGVLSALWVLVAVVAGLIAVGLLQGPDVARTVAVVGGSALLVGWIVGPLLIAGMETTIDGARLAPFPLTTRQVMAALTATGLTGIPGIVTALGAFATVALWVRWPAAAIASVPASALAVLTCVVATRFMGTLSTGLGGNRRSREVVGTVVLTLLIMSGPIVAGILALLDSTGDLVARFTQAGAILGWTPFGAAWAVPGDIAAGTWLTAAVKFAIAVATLAVIWLLWSRALEASLTSPPQTAARAVRRGTLGLFGRMPTGGVGATWARALTAWVRDPRYLRQLLVVPLFPVLFAFSAGVDSALFTASALAAAFVLSVAGYSDISYDGTAFATVLASGVRGREDRLGRVLAAACIGVPLTLVIAVVTLAVAGRLEHLPAVLGGAWGLLLVGYGVTAVSSALIVTPVAAAGDSPFKSVPGQTFVSGLLVFVVWLACAALATPALVLAAIGVATGSALTGGLALAVGMVVGGGVVVAGVVVGGRTLDRTGPDLLARIKAFPV
ncbi:MULTISPECIES: hypothetical protein [Microbacterium]|uniref:ABC-2 type transport system permease protein n=1 Tax=Microbacterium saccharophilum TaxID=1213358 RepID=A0A7Z7CX31_9MICO|nr:MULTISPECIES: hypothetical protein [Microbacterium]SFI38019.1 ABC-2 type transport system permease protein [Microbacterium saccharophilum]